MSSPSNRRWCGVTWYPFNLLLAEYNGLDKGIDVAAGQNSETHPMLDGTNRPDVPDIVGRGKYIHSIFQIMQITI